MSDEGDGRPRWSVSQAAKRAGVARSTIQRYLAQGRMPGAYRTEDGVWSIGVEDLLAAGLVPDRPTPPDTPAEAVPHRPAQALPRDGAEPAHTAELEAALERAEQAERRAAEAESRAAVAEAVARERADRITDLQKTIAALEVGRSDRSPVPAAVPTSPRRQRGLLGRLADNLGL